MGQTSGTHEYSDHIFTTSTLLLRVKDFPPFYYRALLHFNITSREFSSLVPLPTSSGTWETTSTEICSRNSKTRKCYKKGATSKAVPLPDHNLQFSTNLPITPFFYRPIILTRIRKRFYRFYLMVEERNLTREINDLNPKALHQIKSNAENLRRPHRFLRTLEPDALIPSVTTRSPK